MYTGLLIALDGHYVTDYEGKTVDEVIEKLANRGSRWYFYPFEAVIKVSNASIENRKLIDVAPPLEDFKGKKVKTLINFIKNNDLSHIL